MYETDGSTIRVEQQKVDLNYQKPQIKLTIPLKNKVRRTNQNKKKEYHYGPAIAYDQCHFQPSDNVRNPDGNFYKSDIFNVKNMECSLLWMRLDPELEFISKINVIQEEDNWHYQLLKEKDIIGQYEAIQALKTYPTKPAYEALLYVSKSKEYFYKIRQFALKSLSKMPLREIPDILSTERTFIKLFPQLPTPSHPHSSIPLYLSTSLLKSLCCLKESSSISHLHPSFSLRTHRNYSSKEQCKFFIDLLKHHYSSKVLYDDSYYVSTVLE